MDNTKSIKNLLFDLGGVIVDLDRQRCIDEFKKLGLTIADELLGLYVQAGPFSKLESGSISPSEFRSELRKHISNEVPDEQLDYAFCQFIVGIPVKRLEFLRELRKKYKIFMLSNTNEIMFTTILRKCFEIEGKQMNDYFDGIVTSYEAHSMKPDDKIFNYTIEHLNIIPEETIFFDDSQSNLDTAKRFGFETYLVQPGKEFMEYFQK